MTRTRYQLTGVLVAVIFVCAGCATSAEITSNKDETYTETLDRLFVIVQVDPQNEDLGASFQEHIATALTPMGVAVQTRRLTGLELEDNPVQRVIDESSHPVIMTFAQSGGGKDVRSGMVAGAGGMMMPVSSSSSEYAFEASIYDMDLDKRVWRAQIEAKKDDIYGTQGMAGQKVVKKIIEKLQEDGLIAASEPAAGDRASGGTESRK